MNRLDSATLRMPEGAYSMTAEIERGPGVSESSGHDRKGRRYDLVTVTPGDAIPGINRLRFDRQSGSLAVDASAKALLSDYARGIGPDTLERLAEACNRTGIVHVTPEGLLSADLTAADVFVDLDARPDARGPGTEAESLIRDGFTALSALSTNRGFKMETEGAASLRFRTNRKRSRDELGIYAKGPELLHPKTGRSWRPPVRPFTPA